MQYLSIALVILAVTIVMRYLVAAAGRKAALRDDGTMVLRYPGFVAVLGYAVIGFGALIGIVTVFRLVPMTGVEVVPYLVAFFVLLGLPLVLLGNRTRALVTDREVRYTGLTGKTREIRWEEVREVTFSATSEIVLHSERTRIKLNTMLVGLDGFVERMKTKLEPGMYGKALEDWRKAVANMQRRAGSSRAGKGS